MSSFAVASQLSADLAGLVDRARPAVVAVRSGHAAATGTVIGPGRVVTTDHGIDAEADRLEVLAESGPRPARLLGRDPSTDLAVLAVDALDATPLEVAPAFPPVGSLVISVGRAWDRIVASIGLVHAHVGPLLRRGGGRIDTALRTTISPYPGFSGGPLLGPDGRVVALATAGLHRGAGLGLPLDLVTRVSEALGTHGRIRRGFIGITSLAVEVLPPQQGPGGERVGLLVTSLVPEGPAARAGLLVGDILVNVNGHATESAEDLLALLTGDLVGQAVPVTVVRGARAESLSIEVGERGTRAR